MFSRQTVECDLFYRLSSGAQALYLHLMMNADDDGFVGCSTMCIGSARARPRDLDMLISLGFVIRFPNKVCVITHWRINNKIRKDRYKETIYKSLKRMLALGEDGAYFLRQESSAPAPISQYIGAPILCPEHFDSPPPPTDLDAPPLPTDLDAPPLFFDCPMQGEHEAAGAADGKDTSPCAASAEHMAAEATDKKKASCAGQAESAQEPIGPAAQGKEKRARGRYNNVFLTDEEYSSFLKEFPEECDALINRMSEYMQEQGKRYENHIAVLRRWQREDGERRARDLVKMSRSGFFARKAKKEAPKQHYGDFDANEAIKMAIERSDAEQ